MSQSTLQFKRGLSTSWAKYTGILLQGEPGLETDTGKMKIGNGINLWKDLPYVGNDTEPSVVNALTHYDFPSVGSVNVIYKAQDEKKIYQWNPSLMAYEVVSGEGASIDIQLINGGNAYGTNS